MGNFLLKIAYSWDKWLGFLFIQKIIIYHDSELRKYPQRPAKFVVEGGHHERQLIRVGV